VQKCESVRKTKNNARPNGSCMWATSPTQPPHPFPENESSFTCNTTTLSERRERERERKAPERERRERAIWPWTCDGKLNLAFLFLPLIPTSLNALLVMLSPKVDCEYYWPSEIPSSPIHKIKWSIRWIASLYQFCIWDKLEEHVSDEKSSKLQSIFPSHVRSFIIKI